MPLGIQNITQLTIDNVTNLANSSSYAELAVKVNNQVYGGWYFFIMLVVFAIILYFAFDKSEKLKHKPMIKLLYSFMAVTLVSIVARLVEISVNGVIMGLLTDFQMWVFPIVTIIIATIMYATRE